MRRAELIILLSFVLFATQMAALLAWPEYFQVGFVKIANMLSMPISAGQRAALQTALNTLKASEDKRPALCFFGGSTAENLVKYQKKISQETGFTIYSLAFPTQSTYDTLCLADYLKPPCTVIFAIHPAKMANHLDSQVVTGRYMTGQVFYIFLRSQAAEKYYQNGGDWEAKPKKSMRRFMTLNPEFSYIHQVAKLPIIRKRSITNWIKHVKRPVRKRTDGFPGHTKKERYDKYLKYHKSLSGKIDKRIELNFAILHEIGKLLHSNGVKTIILELPIGNIYRDKMKDLIDKYRSAMDSFLSTHPTFRLYKFPWESYKGDESYFSDSMHFSKKGYKIFTEVLISTLNSKIIPENITK